MHFFLRAHGKNGDCFAPLFDRQNTSWVGGYVQESAGKQSPQESLWRRAMPVRASPLAIEVLICSPKVVLTWGRTFLERR